MRKSIAMVLTYLLCPAVFADEQVDLRILETFDVDNYVNATAVSEIRSNRMVHLWCWIRFKSDSLNVAPTTYFIELGYDDGHGRSVLSSWEKEPRLRVERPVDKVEAYYWFVKRVWADNSGDYDYTVYRRRDGQLQSVARRTVSVDVAQ